MYERISKLSQIKNSEKYLTEEEKDLVDFFKNDKMYKELKNLFSNTSLNNVNKLFNIITTKHLDLDDIFIDDYYDDGKYIGFYVKYIEERKCTDGKN